MTLENFINLWGIRNKTMLLCKVPTNENDYDIIEFLDNIKTENELINDYLICAIDSNLTPYRPEIFLKENLLKANVFLFSIINDYLIIFLTETNI